MTTKLDGQLKREIMIGGTPYTLTVTPDKFVLTLKGRRKGLEIRWTDLVSGEAALATALTASLTASTAPDREDVSGAITVKGRKSTSSVPTRVRRRASG